MARKKKETPSWVTQFGPSLQQLRRNKNLDQSEVALGMEALDYYNWDASEVAALESADKEVLDEMLVEEIFDFAHVLRQKLKIIFVDDDTGVETEIVNEAEG